MNRLLRIASVIVRRRPSPAIVIASIALAVALTSTSYAASMLAVNSVGTKQLKKNAVTSPKVKNNSITGADVNEASLGTVPSAANATNAGHATNADQATSATTAVTANRAFSTFHDGPIFFPDTLATIGTLSIPVAGNYVVIARLNAENTANVGQNDECRLTAGGDVDSVRFDFTGASGDRFEIVVLEVVHSFSAAGQVVLACTDSGVGTGSARFTKITAIQVARRTNTGF